MVWDTNKFGKGLVLMLDVTFGEEFMCQRIASEKFKYFCPQTSSGMCLRSSHMSFFQRTRDYYHRQH
jgi:hypothetical protein